MPHMSLICHKKDIIYLQIQTRFEYNKFIGSTQSVPSQDFGTVNVTDKEYTVGIHADVDENTDIKVFVYDGKDTEPYTR